MMSMDKSQILLNVQCMNVCTYVYLQAHTHTVYNEIFMRILINCYLSQTI